MSIIQEITTNSNSYFLPSICSILTFQSSIRSLTRAFRGAIYTAYNINTQAYDTSVRVYITYKFLGLQTLSFKMNQNWDLETQDQDLSDITSTTDTNNSTAVSDLHSHCHHHYYWQSDINITTIITIIIVIIARQTCAQPLSINCTASVWLQLLSSFTNNILWQQCITTIPHSLNHNSIITVTVDYWNYLYFCLEFCIYSTVTYCYQQQNLKTATARSWLRAKTSPDQDSSLRTVKYKGDQ